MTVPNFGRSFIVLALLGGTALAACGSGGAKTAVPGEHDGHGEHGEHHQLQGALKDFHVVLAPIWHSEPGKGRADAACTHAGDMKQRAAALATPPAGTADEAGWKTDADTLATSVDALGAACGADGRPDVEGALGKVHDGFHELMERSGGEKH